MTFYNKLKYFMVKLKAINNIVNVRNLITLSGESGISISFKSITSPNRSTDFLRRFYKC